ncbi:MAG: peptidylprolyl isomerase [Candidatus Micrarchaeota archaeon]
MTLQKLAIGIILLALLVAGCTQSPPANPNPNPNNDNNQQPSGGNTMADTAQNGDTIQVNYKGTLADGTEFDSSLKPGRTPLEFTVGAGQMIKGFDAAVVGMKLNEEKTVTLSPADAYGEKNTTPQTVPKAQFGSSFDQLEVGKEYSLADGRIMAVISKNADSATVTLNSKLAGQALTFWIKIVSIQKKTE